jgi:hypothetical protein
LAEKSQHLDARVKQFLSHNLLGLIILSLSIYGMTKNPMLSVTLALSTIVAFDFILSEEYFQKLIDLLIASKKGLGEYTGFV